MLLTSKFKKGQHVSTPGIEAAGTIMNIRFDDTGNPIYTVNLDDPTATADGLFYARDCELVAA